MPKPKATDAAPSAGGADTSTASTPAKDAAAAQQSAMDNASGAQLDAHIAAVAPAHTNPSTVFVLPAHVPLMRRLVTDVEDGVSGASERLTAFTKALFGHLF